MNKTAILIVGLCTLLFSMGAYAFLDPPAGWKVPQACIVACTRTGAPEWDLVDDDKFECLACILGNIYGQGAGAGDGEADIFQDLKNYLALMNIDTKRRDAILRATKAPFDKSSIFAGFKSKKMDANLSGEKINNTYKKGSKESLDDSLTYFNSFQREGNLEDGLWPREPLPGPVARHLSDFCSATESNEGIGICKDKSVDKPYDLMASSLLSTTQFGSKNRTLEQDQLAAWYYIQNITNYDPLTVLARDKMFSNFSEKKFKPDGIARLYAIYRQQSLLSLAQESFSNMYAERIPATVNDPNTSDPSTQQGASLLQMLEYESNRRFYEPSWNNELNDLLSTQALLREIANMMALNLTLDFRRSQQLERIEALMAAQVSYLAGTIGEVERARQGAQDYTDQYEDD